MAFSDNAFEDGNQDNWQSLSYILPNQPKIEHEEKLFTTKNMSDLNVNKYKFNDKLKRSSTILKKSKSNPILYLSFSK